MGELRALVAKIGFEESRAEPFLNRGAFLHAVQRLAKRARQRRGLANILRQSELPPDAVGTGEDHRAKRHIGTRRAVADAKLEVEGLGDLLLRRGGNGQTRSAAPRSCLTM